MEIQQAVASVTTNNIFKKVVENLGNISKRDFLRFFQVDLKTVEPFYHIGGYSKMYDNNTFLFIDKEFKVIGMLKGNKWDNNQSGLEFYNPNHNNMYGGVIKNWKNMKNLAYYILMFTPEMKMSKQIKSLKVFNKDKELIEKNSKRNKQQDLNNRILSFRIRKYDSISHEELLTMSTQMMEYLVSIMFKPTEFEFYKPELRKIIGWHVDNQFSALEYLTKSIREYMTYYERWIGEKKSIHYTLSYDFTKSYVDQNKIQLMQYWKILKKGI